MLREKRDIKILLAMVSIIYVFSFFVLRGYTDIIPIETPGVTEDAEPFGDRDYSSENSDIVSEEGNNPISKDNDIEKSFKPDSITGLLLGQDFVQGLTDVIMVFHYDAQSNEVKLVSVPRDFYVDFREEPFKTIRANSDYPNMPFDQKLTEIYFNQYKTKEALFVIKDVVSEIIGVDIDYLAVIDIGGFKELVDLAGGVEIYVPHDMDKEDLAQGLRIHLKKGLQVLDGDKAEQFVRYREYTWGDLGRISNQQTFVEAFCHKLIEDLSFNELIDVINKGYDLFDSNFGLTEVINYSNYIIELDMEQVLTGDNIVTLEMTEVVKFGGREALGWDLEQTHEVVWELFYGEEVNEASVK